MAKKKSLEIIEVPVADLIPYAQNSRVHTPGQVKKLAASIREFGFTNPILIAPDRTIVAGHGRVMALELLGQKTAPCIELGHLTDAQRRLYVIADNKLAEESEFDKDILQAELSRILEDDDLQLTLTGFDQDELNDLLDISDGDGGGGDGGDGDDSREASGTVCAIGSYRFALDRDEYLKWRDEIRDTAGFEDKDVHDEIRRRLGMN